MLEYKGYTARVDFDANANIFHGEVEGLRDVITFEGTSVDELRTAFQKSIDDYHAMCSERGEQPERPYSGIVTVRIDPELHRDSAIAAAREGKSLNTWICDALREGVYRSNKTHSAKTLVKDAKKTGTSGTAGTPGTAGTAGTSGTAVR
jgi:predicted HicB family RNase H-like nuclease